jgi:hypothetical protein
MIKKNSRESFLRKKQKHFANLRPSLRCNAKGLLLRAYVT